ncbi:methyl-accepting chemotaxis protein [Aquitalea sp. S1-19]|nr:methyl-accepting chemotaxis protein [Aquitalea sp. S1-19]
MSVKKQLMTLLVAIVLGMVLMAAWGLHNLRSSLQESYQQEVIRLSESALTIIQSYEKAAASGQMPLAEAQTRAKAAVMSSRYGEDGYFFILDGKMNFVAHPVKPQLAGSSMFALKTPDGRSLGDIFSQAMRENAAVYYPWPKPGSDEPVEKVSVVLKSAGWGWIVGTGIYTDEINADVQGHAIEQGIALLILILLLCGLVWKISSNIISQLGGEPAYARQVVRDIAAGRLQTQVKLNAGDHDSLLAGIASMQNDLRSMVGQVVSASEELAGTVGELSSHVAQVAGRASQQSAAASAMAVSVEQMTQSVGVLSGNAEQARLLGARSGEFSREGGAVVRDAADEMREINKKVDVASGTLSSLAGDVSGISSIVAVIRDIADQTNLLALNAAIEAARAGESGRGFAVVADEVRKLAERTSTATGEIVTKIGHIQQLSENTRSAMQDAVGKVVLGVGLTDQGQEAISRIEQSADAVQHAVQDISSALHEQVAASTDIAQHVEQVATSASDNAAIAAEAAGKTEAMLVLARQLQDSVQHFKLH